MRTLHPPRHYAELSGQSTDTVRHFIHTGELRAVNLSKSSRAKWLIAESDWQAFLTAKSNTATITHKTSRRRSRLGDVKEYF